MISLVIQLGDLPVRPVVVVCVSGERWLIVLMNPSAFIAPDRADMAVRGSLKEVTASLARLDEHLLHYCSSDLAESTGPLSRGGRLGTRCTVDSPEIP